MLVIVAIGSRDTPGSTQMNGARLLVANRACEDWQG